MVYPEYCMLQKLLSHHLPYSQKSFDWWSLIKFGGLVPKTAYRAYHHYSNRAVEKIFAIFVNPIMWKIAALIILERIQFSGRAG